VDDTLSNPEPHWLLPGFVPAQGLVIVAGRPKIAKKSWFAYLATMAISSGKQAGPFQPERAANVLFYSRDGAPGPIAHRFRALERGHNIALSECDGLYWVQNGAVFLDEPGHVKQICKVVVALKIECVVFDTFARSFRGNENDAKDVGAAMRGIEKIRDTGAATMLVHHLGKSKVQGVGGEPDPDAGLRGSSALAGAYDNIISIQELEIDGEREEWAVVGGKYVDFCGYKQHWDIRNGDGDVPVSAMLKLVGPQPLPVIDMPALKPRF
jgi:RecA-family ATPase